jgi:hypothetical protein
MDKPGPIDAVWQNAMVSGLDTVIKTCLMTISLTSRLVACPLLILWLCVSWVGRRTS